MSAAPTMLPHQRADGWPPVTAPGWLYGYIAVAVALVAASVALMAAGVNEPLFLALNEAGTAIPSAAWQWITFLGDTHTAVVIAFLFGLRWPQLFWATVFAVVIGGAASHGFKELFDFARPPGVLDTDTFRVIGKAYRSDAFPSGHTLTAFTLAGAVVPFIGGWGWRAAVLAVAALAGLSRVMVGV
ncbi:phosphatase PAP2 family protein, partial [Ectothiorhodospiraceae bacterium WFHF3C12]|nr:phosphatase PAP2 family protein [Ectothiorhodospiraceae bacterium WFHF3C12]